MPSDKAGYRGLVSGSSARTCCLVQASKKAELEEDSRYKKRFATKFRVFKCKIRMAVVMVVMQMEAHRRGVIDE